MNIISTKVIIIKIIFTRVIFLRVIFTKVIFMRVIFMEVIFMMGEIHVGRFTKVAVALLAVSRSTCRGRDSQDS